MGVDIGKKRDPTALAVAKIAYRSPTDGGPHPQKPPAHFLVHHLERLPLGTPYPDAIGRLGDVGRRVAERCGLWPLVFVDATGVGQPIVDQLAASPLGPALWSVYFTRGDRRIEYTDERRISLGKAFLVSRLQALLRDHRIHLPATGEAQALAQELLDYELRVDENANDRYGAFRVGTHDDLVTALGLAVQKEPQAAKSEA